QDYVSVVAEIRSVNVALACNEIERPGEPTGDNLLVEPIGEPADRGHPIASGLSPGRGELDRPFQHLVLADADAGDGRLGHDRRLDPDLLKLAPVGVANRLAGKPHAPAAG